MSNLFANTYDNSDNGDMGSPNLIEESERGDVERMRLALASGANVNMQEQETGITPLHAAITSGNPHSVLLLLEQEGIDVDIEDNFGRTALSMAMVAPNTQITQILMDFQSAPRSAGGAQIFEIPSPE